MADMTPFLRPIAHRGLHNRARGIVENSASAARAAIAKGYGIECDVRAGADGLPLVFHDDNLSRLIGVSGALSSVSADDLSRYTYAGTSERIITLEDLLDIVEGQVPLLVEIKSEWDAPNREFLQSIAVQASRYRGPIAVMSFDPAVIEPFCEFAPFVPRGIVSGSYGENWWDGKLSPERKANLRDLLESRNADPDFYAYEVGALPTPVTRFAREALGLPLFTWTVRTNEDKARALDWADAPIFEGYEP